MHGHYLEKESIILSGTQYDNYYGIEISGSTKQNLGRPLGKRLYELQANHPFLFIGHSLNLKQDRMLRLLEEFAELPRSVGDSYALLNIDEVEGDFKRRVDELLAINVRPIWYSDNVHGHANAIRELFDFLLKDLQEDYRAKAAAKAKKDKEDKEAEKHIEEAQQRAYDEAEVIKSISIPKEYHNKANDKYEFSHIKMEGQHYLSDQGKTFKMLDEVFELSESDVKRNIDAILKECNVEKIASNKLIILLPNWDELTPEDQESLIEKVKHILFTCVSFLDTMRIFYV